MLSALRRFALQFDAERAVRNSRRELEEITAALADIEAIAARNPIASVRVDRDLGLDAATAA